MQNYEIDYLTDSLTRIVEYCDKGKSVPTKAMSEYTVDDIVTLMTNYTQIKIEVADLLLSLGTCYNPKFENLVTSIKKDPKVAKYFGGENGD